MSKNKKVTYKISPDQGAIALLTKITLPGYRVVNITRKNDTAVVEYERV